MIALNDCGPEILQLATNYAADYLNYVENLPFDLQRKVTKLREIDLKCREYVREIEQLYDNFKKENDGTTTVRRRSYLLQIRRLFGLCKELGDEKISIVQSLSEVIESRNKQLEYERKRFQYAYEPNIKSEHGGKKEKDSKSDSSRGHKRSRRQRNNNSLETKEKILHYKDPDKTSRSAVNDDADEPSSKILAASTSPEQVTPTAIPAMTRAALREEDKRISIKTKDRKDDKVEKDDEKTGGATSGKNTSETLAASVASSSTSSASSRGKNGVNAGSASAKSSTKGKKKKRKSNKYQTERHASNSGEVSPLIDVPIDPYEPTYCLCQQVSFGQMIGCDNPKCPIEWFHFSCVRLTHKPKGKWYCPDCTIKRKRENKSR